MSISLSATRHVQGTTTKDDDGLESPGSFQGSARTSPEASMYPLDKGSVLKSPELMGTVKLKGC